MDAFPCEFSDADDGYSALEVLKTRPVDVVIMDVHMNRMDGIEATRRIRSSDTTYSNVPIIVLTADNMPEISASSLAAGANIFLTKPVLKDELIRALNYALKDSDRLQKILAA